MNASNSANHDCALIQLATDLSNGKKTLVSCTVSAMRGKRLAVSATEPIQLSSAVSVEYEDALFLGEVISCSNGNGNWDIEIKVHQVLTGLQSLMMLRERLLDEGVPKQQLEMVRLGAAS